MEYMVVKAYRNGNVPKPEFPKRVVPETVADLRKDVKRQIEARLNRD